MILFQYLLVAYEADIAALEIALSNKKMIFFKWKFFKKLTVNYEFYKNTGGIQNWVKSVNWNRRALETFCDENEMI